MFVNAENRTRRSWVRSASATSVLCRPLKKYQSSVAGKFKGYGLIQFVHKSSSIQARHVLDEQEVRGGHVIVCDWLKPVPKPASNPVKPISLHSKCLYVDQLAEDYRDMGEFRRLFSKIVNPPYCQVSTRCKGLMLQ